MVTLNVSKPVVQIVGNTSPASGEANTVSNLGTGAGIYKQKIGVDLQFKSLVAGSGVSIAANTNDLTISSTASAWGGITGTLSNQTDLQAALNAKQTSDSTLTALAAYNTNGLITQTAADTFVGRSIVAGTNKIIITNGNGVAGNPTVDVNEANFTGIPESAVTNLVSDLASKLSANQTITIAGDVTGSGATSITAIIPNDTVTFPKMQNIATGVILGRGSAGTGDIEQITVGAGLTLSGGTLTLAAAPAAVWGTITGTLSSQTDLQTALNAKLGTGLASTHIFVGSIGGVATDVAVSGDMSITNAGAVTVSGLQTKALPALATGLLKYNGTAWVFDSSAYLTANQTITLSGDATGSGATAIAVTLPNVNSNVGTFNNVTVNAKGQVTAASNVSYLTANQTITLSGDVTGSGTTAITSTVANDAITFPKMQNIATNTLIGRSTAGNGDPEQITVGSGLTLSAGTISVTGGGSGWPFTGTGTFTGAVVIDETVTGTNTLIFQANALGTTPVNGKGLWLQNSTAAALNAQQISPSIVWEGQGWATGVNNSQSMKFMSYVLPVQAATNPTGKWILASSINGGTYGNVATIDNSGNTVLTGQLSVSTQASVGAINIAAINSSDPASVTSGDIWYVTAGGGNFRVKQGTQANYIATLGSGIVNGIPFGSSSAASRPGELIQVSSFTWDNSNTILTFGLGILRSNGSQTQLYYSNTSNGNLIVGGANAGVEATIGALSSGWKPSFRITPGAHTSMTSATEFIANDFKGATWTWLDGTVPTQRFNYFRGFTLNKTTTSATFTNVYTMYVDGPVMGSGVTATTAYTMFLNPPSVGTGSIGTLWTLGVNGPTTITGTSNATGLLFVNGKITAGTDLAFSNTGSGTAVFEFDFSSVNRIFTLKGDHTNNGPTWPRTMVAFDNVTTTASFGTSTVGIAQVYVLQAALTTTGGIPVFRADAGAHTNLTLSTEVHDVNINLNRTVQWATGALTLQRAFRIQNPTYAFVGASTITDAATVAIDGAPIAGTNATITNAHGLYISAASLSGGNTNGYGLTVNAPTGAFSLNAAAQFLGGTTFFAAATTSYASIILPHGTAPTSPVDGAMWTTSAGGLYVRINGVTVGPLGTGGGGGITNSAAANELMKSDGTNATPSGLFTATNGDITLGSTSIIGNRTIITSGSGNQSNLSILAMDSIVATQNGSSITLTPGAGNTSGAGGALNLNAGAGGITGVGGTITLLGGNGGATSGNGGDITITAGSAQGGNSNGGTLSLNGGAGNGSGVDGGIVLGTNSGVSIYGGNNGGVLFGNAGTNETRIKATNTNSTIKVHLKLEGTTASSGTVDGGDIILLGGSPSGAAAYGVINIATGLKKSTTTSSAGSLTLDRTSVIWVFTGSSATTWTLPDLASNVDLHYMIKNRGSANITLQSAGSDSIYDSSVVTSITITPSQAFIIQNDGTYWITM